MLISFFLKTKEDSAADSKPKDNGVPPPKPAKPLSISSDPRELENVNEEGAKPEGEIEKKTNEIEEEDNVDDNAAVQQESNEGTINPVQILYKVLYYYLLANLNIFR